MREIKFRAWDKESKRMYDWTTIKQYPVHYTFDSDIVIPMQYTGFKDKNGTEIYEGDIATAWSQGYQATGEVKQRIDGLWLMYPAYQHGKQWGLCPNPKGETTVEIIGNIHDNPELLGGAE